MNRRAALIAMGTMVACMGGVAKAEPTDIAETNILTGGSTFTFQDWSAPTSYHFEASGIKDIIITRSDKEDIVIPFSEIIEALEGV